MSLPPDNEAFVATAEATVDVTMTTPEETAIPTTSMDAHRDVMTIAPPPPPTTKEDARNAETRQKIADIISHQFDLEILLRHAEGTAIAKELAKAESMLEDLRHAILSERQGFPYGNSTVSRTSGYQTSQQQNSHYNSRQSSRRTTAHYGKDVRHPEALYAVRADGQFVRLGCPKCDRYDFGSIQGLVNHMRLSHKLVFKNTEEGVRFCGIVVPSSEVPPDHPCRSKVVFSSLGVSDALLGQSDFPKPTIKTYDEDVDLDSDDGRARSGNHGTNSQSRRKHSNGSVDSSSNGESGSESDTSDMGSGGESGLGVGKRRRSSLGLSLPRPQKGTSVTKAQGQGDSDSDGSEDNEDSGNEGPRPPAGKGPMRKYGSVSQGLPSSSSTSSRIPSTKPYSVPDSRMSSAPSSRVQSPTIHPLVSENDFSEPSTPVSGFTGSSVPTPTRPFSAVSSSVSASSSATTLATPQPPLQPQQLQPPIISFGASAIQAGVPAPLDTVGSRFYVKRRVVVGNVSKYLPEAKRDPRLKEFPFKWMIYVDGVPKPEDITAYVSKVEFHLHESYKPNHIVTVSEPPFHLSRYAWGETQIKVRLLFHDPRNKPVEVYHRLTLDPTHCGRQVHGGERHVDLELDRNTTFLAPTPLQSRSKGSSSHAKSSARNNLILNSAAEVAMAANAEEDEQELQNTLSKPPTSATVQGVSGVRTGSGGEAGGLVLRNGTGAAAAAVVDTVRAASVEGSLTKNRKVKESTLLYCKACGSLWRQHKEGELGVAGTLSEPVLLSEDTGQRIPHCPHHVQFFSVKDVGEDESMLLPLLMGRSKNKFALDMLKNCGIVDQQGRPISSHDRMLMELQQSDSTMDVDIGDSEIPTPPLPSTPAVVAAAAPNPTSLQSIEQRSKVQQLAEAFKKMEVYKCRRSEIDWVLSVMDELKMKTLLLDGGVGGGSGGSRSGLRDRGQEQEQLLNTPGLEEVPESMSQRAVVGGLLVQATKAFLGSVLSKAISVHRAETEAEKGPESIMMELDALGSDDDTEDGSGSRKKESTKVADKLLAPYHVYRALQSNPEELDFLTSQYEDMDGIGDMMVGL